MADVFEIAEASGLSVARVRYVIDHDVVYGTQQARCGHRVTRQFKPFDGFAIAIAGWLMEGGLRRQTVKPMLKGLFYPAAHLPRAPKAKSTKLPENMVPIKRVERVPLLMAFELGAPLNLSIGDGQNLRFWNPHGPSHYDTEWFQAMTLAKLKDYEPMVTITLNVGRLAQNMRKLP